MASDWCWDSQAVGASTGGGWTGITWAREGGPELQAGERSYVGYHAKRVTHRVDNENADAGENDDGAENADAGENEEEAHVWLGLCWMCTGEQRMPTSRTCTVCMLYFPRVLVIVNNVEQWMVPTGAGLPYGVRLLVLESLF